MRQRGPASFPFQQSPGHSAPIFEVYESLVYGRGRQVRFRLPAELFETLRGAVMTEWERSWLAKEAAAANQRLCVSSSGPFDPEAHQFCPGSIEDSPPVVGNLMLETGDDEPGPKEAENEAKQTNAQLGPFQFVRDRCARIRVRR